MTTVQAELPTFFKGRLSVIGHVTRPTGETLPVGTDGRVYELTKGLVKAWIPFDPSREWETDPQMNENDEALVDWDREAVPPHWMIRRVHRHLKDYVQSKEAMAFVGRRPASPRDSTGALYDWLFIVPEQRCSGGGVESDDEKAPTMFRKMGYKMTGTLHTHPGESVGYSGIDFEWYKKVNGVHLIVSQTGKRAEVHVSVDVQVWTVEEIILPDVDWSRMERTGRFRMVTSENRKMKDLFKEWRFQPSWPTSTVVQPSTTITPGERIVTSPATTGRMWFPDWERSNYSREMDDQDQLWWDEYRESLKARNRDLHLSKKARKALEEKHKKRREHLDDWMRDHPISWMWAGEVKVLKGAKKRWVTASGLPHMGKLLPTFGDMVDELWTDRVVSLLNQVLRVEV